jgi:transcriptional regulator with XRE-family HTH domain
MSAVTPPPPAPSPDEALLAEVRACMARRRVTGRDLANGLGMGRQSMQRRLTGEVPFRIGELIAIAVLLDVPVSTFTDVMSSAQSGLSAAG